MRTPIKKVEFEVKGIFQSLYAAERWATENGYSYGSLDYPNPIALCKGKYILAQKWHNIPKSDIDKVDGVIRGNDMREGKVEIIIYK